MFIRSEMDNAEEIRIKPLATDNRMKLLLSKSDKTAQVFDSFKRLMADIDPNRS